MPLLHPALFSALIACLFSASCASGSKDEIVASTSIKHKPAAKPDRVDLTSLSADELLLKYQEGIFPSTSC